MWYEYELEEDYDTGYGNRSGYEACFGGVDDSKMFNDKTWEVDSYEEQH